MSNDDLHTLSGPSLLLAGPGTGKTYRLGKRIKHLVEEKHVPPDEITVITFTAAAARNMRDRISDDSRPAISLPYASQPKSICTMHSLGYRIIRENAPSLGLREPLRVVPDELRLTLLGDAAQLAGFPRSVGEDTAQCRQNGDCKPESIPKCKTCDQYKAILHCCSCVDHDEQVLLACRFLKDNPTVLAKYRAFTRHLLVDEYQDINAAQFELISLLSDGQRDGLFVVGDDDQSIYSWRGGSPDFIRRFKEDFGSEATVEPLVESFRCGRHILEGALSVVQQCDSSRLDKGNFTYTKDGLKIQVHNVPSDAKEAREVKKILQRVLPSQDVLILFPHRTLSAAIAKELRASQIPFTSQMTFPGAGLPLVSSLSLWLADPLDSLSFRRCLDAYLENPAKGIPSKRVKKLEKKEQREEAFGQVAELWNPVISGDSHSLWDALNSRRDGDDLYRSLYSAFSGLLELGTPEGDPAAFLARLAEEMAPWRKVSDFLSEASSWVELASQSANLGQTTDVRLMTFQAAKGLEAKVVCVIGLEEGTMPREDSNMAEQSRLLFVSMTRAVNELHLFHARKRSGQVVFRNMYKDGGPPSIRRSRFVDAIPKEHSEEVFHQA